MNAEIVQFTSGALAVAADQTTWTDQQIAVLHGLGIDEEKVTQAEMDVFLHECQRTALDPFTKQIYLIGRYDSRAGREVFRSQTGIDGYRVVAHRAARRDRVELSYSDTLWCGPDGTWRDVWLDRDNPPLAAKVTVCRNDKPFPAIATLAEYAATYKNGDPTPMWRRMPSTMLAKCAEALALRKAFPQDLAGIYTAEEMEQADNSSRQAPERPAKRQQPTAPADDEWSTPGPPPAAQPPVEYAEVVDEPAPAIPAPPARPEQINSIVGGLTAVRGVKDRDAARAAISYIIGRQIDSARDLTAVEADQVLAVLRAEAEQKQQGTPAGGPAPVGSPDNPQASEAQQKMMNGLLNQAGYGQREKALDLIRRILVRPGLQSRSELSKSDAQRVIDAVDRLMKTGEMPPPLPAEQPAAAEPFVHPNDEGFDVFDALNQMILDVNSEETFVAAQAAIEDELKRGEISAESAQTLRNRLAEQTGAMAA